MWRTRHNPGCAIHARRVADYVSSSEAQPVDRGSFPSPRARNPALNRVWEGTLSTLSLGKRNGRADLSTARGLVAGATLARCDGGAA